MGNKNTWIIVLTTGGDNTVEFYKFYGTEQEIKMLLIKFAKSYINGDDYDECALKHLPYDENDIELDSEGNLRCHIEYDVFYFMFAARKISEINELFL